MSDALIKQENHSASVIRQIICLLNLAQLTGLCFFLHDSMMRQSLTALCCFFACVHALSMKRNLAQQVWKKKAETKENRNAREKGNRKARSPETEAVDSVKRNAKENTGKGNRNAKRRAAYAKTNAGKENRKLFAHVTTMRVSSIMSVVTAWCQDQRQICFRN